MAGRYLSYFLDATREYTNLDVHDFELECGKEATLPYFNMEECAFIVSKN